MLKKTSLIASFFIATLFSSLLAQLPAGLGRGSSLSETADLEEQARTRGYSDEQIAQMKKRYVQQGGNGGSVTSSPYFSEFTKPIASDDSLLLLSDSMTQQEILAADTATSDSVARDSASGTGLPFFGYSVFKHIPDAFKPNAIGRVDPRYLVGPGDVLHLSVWGEVEFQYELKVNKEGKVFIPVAGQVHVSGVPFETLQKKLQSILSRHYSGLASNPQKSFIDLSVAQLHPIRIFMMGEVRAPGGYTVATSSTAFNALYSVGGPRTSGSLREITVLRNQEEIAHLDLYEYLLTGRCSTDVRLLSDDVVFTPKRGTTVAVTGAVFRPALYELKKGEQMLSLLSFCGGVLSKSNSSRALIKRVRPFNERIEGEPVVQVVNVDLQKLFTDSVDIPLYDNDTLEVVPLANDLENYATISGAVHYPGMYQVDNLSLYSLIFSFGKLIETRAYTKRADLIRLNSDRVTFSTIPVNLAALKADSAANDMMLSPYDQVVIYEKEVEKPTDLLITIEGEVRSPGAYTMSTNQTVIDGLLRAGGFTRQAYRRSLDIYRLKLSGDGSDTITEVLQITLPDSINYNVHRDEQFLLKDRDKIVVRPDPDYITDNYVTINGLVRFRGVYAIKLRGERLSDIIYRAGGLLPDAFLEGASIMRGNKRVVVDFSEALSGKTSKENIYLQKNDVITIPPRPNTVLVSGNVNNPGLFSFVEKSKLRTYIDRAGGFADSTAFILLTSPGGETKKVGKCSFTNPEVSDGSEIVVIKKPPRDKSLEKQGPTVSEVVRDTLAILASAITVITLMSRL